MDRLPGTRAVVRRSCRLGTLVVPVVVVALGISAVLAPGGARGHVTTPWHPKTNRSLAPAAQEARARVAYARLWTKAAPLLGAAGQPAPRLRFVAPSDPRSDPSMWMWVGPDEGGRRTIFITPGHRRLLAKRGGNWRSYYAGLTHALHETAHVFQSDEVLRDPVGRERLACQWTRAHAPTILGTARKRVRVSYDSWRDRGQFGMNFGGDPTSFGWPGWSTGTGGVPPTGGGGAHPPAGDAVPVNPPPGIWDLLGL
jgi:hypothetical protein